LLGVVAAEHLLLISDVLLLGLLEALVPGRVVLEYSLNNVEFCVF